MFEKIKKLFSRPSLGELANTPGSGVMNDPDFGMISYEPPCQDGQEGFWQMYNDWEYPEFYAKVGCSMIPGDENGPSEIARKFLLDKRGKLNELWDMCHIELVKIIEQRYPKESARKPNEIYYLSSLSMENSKGDEWEVSFEARDGLPWTFTSFQIKENQIVGNTTDT